ncbi:MAG: tetratricopeptide repeat protein [bacterium]|nr:tetratricopeptide repeat protein [bacterium]
MKRYLILIFLLTLLFSGCTGSGKYLKQATNFGIKAAKKGYWSEAKFRWERLLAEDPNDFVAMNNLAVCYEQEGKFEDAVELYKKALELSDNNKYIKINLQRAELLRTTKEIEPQPVEENK